MNKLLLLARSRTFWTIAVMFAVGGVDEIRDFIPDNIETPLLGVLAAAAAYFRANAKPEK